MVTLATKTLQAIEDAIARDQGASFREWQGRVFPHMKDAYRGADDGPFRSHLGASQIGSKCARALWYGFHWATQTKFSGRVLRLFNRGHLEEARFIAMLLMIGVQVYQQDDKGEQYRITGVGGHFGGSGDGVGKGVPDLPPGLPCVLEFKTHGDKSFKELKKIGVREAKLEHFIQMQTYMRKMNLTAALYMAVNKNDDELYAEIVLLDIATADSFIDRGRKIINIVELQQPLPKKLNPSPGWVDCQWCDHRPVCHLGVAPDRNCRTCEFSVPKEEGGWWCENKERQMKMLFGPNEGVNAAGETFQLSKPRQLSGCTMYTVAGRFKDK